MNVIAEARSLSKEFQGTTVLRNINITVKKGEFIAVMGQSGCGKSTLLYNLSGMDRPTSGKIFFDGQELQELPEPQMSSIRLKKMGFVFQKANLLRSLSVMDNIIFPAYQAGIFKKEEINENARRWMEQTGILSSATVEIMDIFNRINAEGTAILMVTHDGKVASRTDRIIYLEDGAVGEELILGKYSKEGREEREKRAAAFMR